MNSGESIDPRVFNEMVVAIQRLVALSWRLQARINVLESICLQTIEDVARFHDDPKAYVRRYVERAKARALPLADVDDPTKRDQTIKERDHALDDYLTMLLERAGDLKI